MRIAKWSLPVLMLLLTVATVAPAYADTYTYVGSWEVDSGPSWTEVPALYTGQQAAALLFGGTPSNYVISTNGSSSADINFENWVSTWGGACGGNFPCGTLSADNFVEDLSEDGLYDTPGDTSSYVSDWAVGPAYTNYAFEVSATPEPSSLLMLGTGLVGFAGFMRRKLARKS